MGALFKIAGISAILMAVLIPMQILVFILAPPPATVTGWVELFHKNTLVGLIDADLLLIVDQVLIGMILLSLFIVLRKSNPSYTLIAFILGILGIASYMASTMAFELLSLSNQYAVASSAEQKTTLLAAGQVLLLNWQGTAFDVGYVLEGISLTILGFVMLKSNIFSRVTALIGLIVGFISLLPPNAGVVGMAFALGSLIPLEIWAILVAKRFWQM